MPACALVVQWFSVTASPHARGQPVSCRRSAAPTSALRIRSSHGPGPRAERRDRGCGLDVGILQSDQLQARPAPDDYYLGQRKLIDRDPRPLWRDSSRNAGTAGRSNPAARCGVAAELQCTRPPAAAGALFRIVTVKPMGRREIVLDLPTSPAPPRHGGRLEQVPGRAGAVGDVPIRNPVGLTATLPRFLLNGDRGTMHLTRQRRGRRRLVQYRVRRARSSPWSAVRPAPTLRLNAKEAFAQSPLYATAAGTAIWVVRVSGPGGLTSRATILTGVGRRPRSCVAATVRTIASGESVTLSNDMFADLCQGTVSVAVSSASRPPLDAGGRCWPALDRYPFGAGAITSRAPAGRCSMSRARHETHPGLDAACRSTPSATAIDRLLGPQGFRRSRSAACGRRRAPHLASTPMLRLPARAARTLVRGARGRVQHRARPAATSLAHRAGPDRTAAAILPMRSMCCAATGGADRDCSISRTQLRRDFAPHR